MIKRPGTRLVFVSQYNILFLIIVQIEGAAPIRGGAILAGDSLQTRDGAGAPGKDEREGKDAEREEGVRENGSGREEARPKMEVYSCIEIISVSFRRRIV